MRFLFIILLIPSFSKAQDSLLRAVFPCQDNKVHYESVIIADSSTKLQLFEKAKIWSLKTFNSSKDAQQSEDKDLGFITYKTFFDVPPASVDPKYVPDPKYNTQYWFTVKIYLKDRKAKILIDDILLSSNSTDKINIESVDSLMKEQQVTMRKQLHNKKYDKFFTPEAERKGIEEMALHYRNADSKFKLLIESFKIAMTARSESDF